MGGQDVILQGINGAWSRRNVERVLWLHATDRWYFGDFLRHSAWLTWLLDTFPGAAVDLASYPAYLSLYEDHRFGRRLDARSLRTDHIASYDLVIVPGPHEHAPADALAEEQAGQPRPALLTTWDTGWALWVDGRIQQRGAKADLSYFRAAHPSTLSTSTLSTSTVSTSTVATQVRPTPPVFAVAEVEAAEQALSLLFPGDAPVIVYNPTASNAFTRGTGIPKEVDNALTAREHAIILRRLLVLFPGHLFLVGAALKPADAANLAMIEEVTLRVGSDRVAGIDDLQLPQARTLRGFAAVLASRRVCSMTGSGTGTNTHLAALLDVPSLSVERGVDAAMLANWHSSQFQMGSFRWRNPATCTAIHTINWESRTNDALEAAAASFLAHHALHHGDTRTTIFTDLPAVAAPVKQFGASWPEHPLDALRAGRELLAFMREPARAHYGAFGDEAAYLAFRHGLPAASLDSLTDAMLSPDGETRRTAIQLFQDSNLHKLLTHLHTLSLAGTPAPAEGAHA